MNDVVKHEPSRAPARARPTSAADLVGNIIAAARDPSVDVNKVDRLHQILKEMRAEDALKAFNKAMNKLQKSLPHITRNVKSDKGWYADLEAIDLGTRDLILGAGFSENYGTANSHLADHYRFTCDLRHNEGHVEHYFVDCPITTKGAQGNAVMTPIHAFGSNATYGRRYLKVLMFNIVLKGDDNDGKAERRRDGVSYINSNQIAEMRREINERGVNLPILLDYYNIEGLDMMPAADFGPAMQKIRSKPKLKQVSDARTE